VTTPTVVSDRSGRQVEIGPYSSRDAADLQRFADGLSAETAYLRFHQGTGHVTGDALRAAPAGRALVARAQGAIVGVATWVPLPASDEAEIALVVADGRHDRGIGSALFDAAGDAARGAGIRTFLAYVLTSNRGMRDLIDDLGFLTRRRHEGGVDEFHVSLEPTEAHSAGADLREHRGTKASLRPLFAPAAVAVIGASREPRSVGHAVLANLAHGGFAGPVYPVNPHATAVAGLPCFPRTSDLPGPVDLAVVTVPAALVAQAVDDAVAAGAGALIVLAAGFAEASAAGRVLQQDLLDRCRRAGVRMLGPNCLGLLVNRPGALLDATFSPVRPPAGNVALVSQSGAVGLVTLHAARERGIGLSCFASVGNRADVSANDVLEWLEDDQATDVIAIYTESFGNAGRLARIARRIAEHKPIVLVKAGGSSAGARAAQSHTAAMATPDAVVDALLDHARIVRVASLEEMLDAVRLLATTPPMRGRRIGIVTNAGGLGILCADAAQAGGLEVPALSGASVDALRAALSPAASVANPIDVLAEGGPPAFGAAFAALAASGAVDAVVALHVATHDGDSELVATAIREGREGPLRDLPVVAALVGSAREPATLNPSGSERIIPSFPFGERAARALAIAADVATLRARPTTPLPRFAIDGAAARAALDQPRVGEWLRGDAALGLLAAYGIAVAPTSFARTAADAVAAADAIGYPVAVKLVSATILHKTDVGGVRLRLATGTDVASAFAAIERAAGGAFDGVLVQPMLEHGVECLVGVIRDPDAGPVLAFGAGGTDAELYGDLRLAVTPLTGTDAARLVASTRVARALAGWRGAPACDVGAVHRVLRRVARLAEDVPAIAELDINPLACSPTAAVALDVRVRVSD
jgi:acyl-CoA synthetase (NDP forming)/GNAT superfamily N-acetyltransferase